VQVDCNSAKHLKQMLGRRPLAAESFKEQLQSTSSHSHTASCHKIIMEKSKRKIFHVFLLLFLSPGLSHKMIL